MFFIKLQQTARAKFIHIIGVCQGEFASEKLEDWRGFNGVWLQSTLSARGPGGAVLCPVIRWKGGKLYVTKRMSDAGGVRDTLDLSPSPALVVFVYQQHI